MRQERSRLTKNQQSHSNLLLWWVVWRPPYKPDLCCPLSPQLENDQNHSIWKLEGDQIRADFPVSLYELALGATVNAVTPDGEAQLTIPARTLPGSSLRLKDKGWPINNGRGDLILTLALCFPSCLSSKEIDLFNQLRELSISDPRKEWINSARL